MFRTTKFVTFTRYWGVRKFRRPTGFSKKPAKVSSIQMHRGGGGSCLVWQLCNTKMDLVLAALNDTPSGRRLGLSLMAYSEGTFDEEELILLGLGLEIGDARCYFALPRSVPARPLLALDEATFVSEFRFTQRQLEAIHVALALPTDFARKQFTPGRVVNTDRGMYSDSHTHCQRKCCSSKLRRSKHL